MYTYEKIVRRICSLRWETLSPAQLQILMVMMVVCAQEFAESLRIALRLYPENESLKEMAEEELETDTLEFEDYQIFGDHWEYLLFFVEKYCLRSLVPRFVHEACAKYLKVIRSLSPEVRAMSIVSRENDLPSIFVRVLMAKCWEAKGLKELRYYLEEHVRLDSQEGGHADKLSNFEVDDRVRPFWEARLELILTCLPELNQEV